MHQRVPDLLTNNEKKRSPEEAAKMIKSGDKIVLANLCAEPRLLPDSIVDRAHELQKVSLFHLKPMGEFVNRLSDTGMETHIRCASAFTGGVKPLNRLISEGRADFYPIPLSRLPSLFRSNSFKPDVFITTVSPPDNQGFCSLGISVDYARAAIETAGTVVAEVNGGMPRTSGDSLIHLSQIDCIVESQEPIYETPAASPSILERKIAENVASVVEDEATIQIGFGAVSESITPFLKEKRDLGIHSEMFPESAITLVEHGALTCSRKSIDRNKIVCAFSCGSRKFYDWLNDNPKLEMRPFDYTNDSRIISKNHKMTSINTAMQVDLFGSTYSDMLGFDQYSGPGGQPDFVLGALMCPDGRSIIALPSTALDGKVSRIVVHPAVTTRNFKTPRLPTLSRFFADYVVTEYGVASIRDKTTRERAKALLELAHPDFKDELWEEGKKLNLLS